MSWNTFSTEIDGKPAIVLIDCKYSDEQPSVQLPKLAWFAVYCKEAPHGGIWSEAETEKLEEIETDLLGLCDKHSNGWAVYVLNISTPGINEYYIYFGGNAELHKVMGGLEALHKDYKFDFDITDDVTWYTYKKWLVLNNA